MLAQGGALPRVRSERFRLGPAAFWTGLALGMLGLLATVWILDGVREGNRLASWDLPVWEWFIDHRTPALTTVMTAVTTLTGEVVLPLIIVVVAAGWFLRTRAWWHPALLVGSMLVAVAISTGMKHLVGRVRPPQLTMIGTPEATMSFPSGHTIAATTMFLVGGYLLWSRRRTIARFAGWLLLAGGASLLVAASRLYLGFHWLTDVLASLFLAVAVLGLVLVVDTQWRPATDRIAVPPGDPVTRPATP